MTERSKAPRPVTRRKVTATYSMQAFVKDARETIDRRLSAEKTLALLASPLERIIARADCLAEVSPHGTPDPDESFPIYTADDLSILCVVWQPGAGTPIHNHNGWAMEGIIRGLERNRNYARLDDASRPWQAVLEEVEPSIVKGGEITCLDLPPNDIHAVEIPGGKTLAVHVYGNDIARQWCYQFNVETGEVKPFVSGTRIWMAAK